MELTRSFLRKNIISIDHSRIEDLDRLFKDNETIEKILSLSKSKGVNLTEISKFFNIRNNGEKVVSIGFKLSEDSTVEILDQEITLDSGIAWLRYNKELSVAELHWTDENSNRHHSTKFKLGTSSAIKPFINFDESYIYRSSLLDHGIF